MNASETQGKPRPETLEADNCTFYRVEAFGAQGVACRKLSLSIGRFAQYERAVRVTFTAKGKRTERAFADGRQPTLVVLAGLGHPERLSSAMTPGEITDTGFCVSKTRHASFAPEWRTEFDEDLAAYLAARPEVVVLADFRGFGDQS